MQAYSIDLRRRVLSDCQSGLTTSQAADKYYVTSRWVRKLKRRWREEGELGPRRQSRHRRPMIDRPQLARLVEQQPDATLAELRDRLGVHCSLVAIWAALKQLKLTYKKRRSGPASRTVRTLPKSGRSGRRSKSASTRKN